MLADGRALGAKTSQSMLDNMESVCLVRECQELEETFCMDLGYGDYN